MNFAIYFHFQNKSWESKENRKKKKKLTNQTHSAELKQGFWLN